jgi:hypothetical protein
MKEIITSEFSARQYSPIVWTLLLIVAFFLFITPFFVAINTYLLAKPYSFAFIEYSNNKVFFTAITLIILVGSVMITNSVRLEILDYSSQKMEVIAINIISITHKTNVNTVGTTKYAVGEIQDGTSVFFPISEKMIARLGELPVKATIWRTKYRHQVLKLILDDGQKTYSQDDII